MRSLGRNRSLAESAIPNNREGQTGTDDGVRIAPMLHQILESLNEIRELVAGRQKSLYTVEEVAELTGRAVHDP